MVEQTPTQGVSVGWTGICDEFGGLIIIVGYLKYDNLAQTFIIADTKNPARAGFIKLQN